jgi:hypothetical protein
MRAAIMQPTYLPWAGYFDLMDQVDVFVLLDTVQFDKRSWQQRNRIKGPQGLQMLTVPVKSKGKFHQTIRDVEIAAADFANAHLASIAHAYGKAPYFGVHRHRFEAAMLTGAASLQLASLTATLIDWLATELGLTTRRVAASGLGSTGKRSELLAAICAEVAASVYVSPAGAGQYLAEERASFDSRGIEVLIQNYVPQPYPQLFPPFAPYASAIDILFNCGPGSLDVIRAGRRPPVPLAEWPAGQQAEAWLEG